MQPETTLIDDILEANRGMDRRSFIKAVTVAAAAVGLTSAATDKIVAATQKGLKPPVIWLHYQECTGCTESLLRTTAPDIGSLILDLVSLEYHETLMAAAGYQAEEALKQAMEKYAGKFILVVEGAIPTKDNGIYCKVAGKTAIDALNEVASKAGAIVAIGSCASWGGIPSTPPNPTGSVGAPEILKGKTVVTLPGCPANPYVFLGTALQFAVLGTLPALDNLGRPLHAYARTIHEDCPRRAHFDAGRFASQYGDEGHRLGYCLYKLGCKGPVTHASCSILKFGEVDAWPIGVGHPCFGCTEQKVAFKVPLHDTVTIDRPTPPDTYPPIRAAKGNVGAWATGIAGLVAGGLLGAGYMASKKLDAEPSVAEKKKE